MACYVTKGALLLRFGWLLCLTSATSQIPQACFQPFDQITKLYLCGWTTMCPSCLSRCWIGATVHANCMNKCILGPCSKCAWCSSAMGPTHLLSFRGDLLISIKMFCQPYFEDSVSNLGFPNLRDQRTLTKKNPNKSKPQPHPQHPLKYF